VKAEEMWGSSKEQDLHPPNTWLNRFLMSPHPGYHTQEKCEEQKW